VIRIVFQCDGAAGRERLHECDEKAIFTPDGCGVGKYEAAVVYLRVNGWTFRHHGERFILRCPKCEALRVRRNAARAQRDKFREDRKR